MFGVKLESVNDVKRAIRALRSLKGQERKLLMQQGIILNKVKDEGWYKDVGDGTLTGEDGFYARIGYSRNHCAKVMRLAREPQVRDAFEDLGVRKAGAIEALGRHLEDSGVEDAEKEQVVADVIEKASNGATAKDVETAAKRLEDAAESGGDVDAGAAFSSIAAESEDEDESSTEGAESISLEDALAGDVDLGAQDADALVALEESALVRLEELREEQARVEALVAAIGEATGE